MSYSAMYYWVGLSIRAIRAMVVSSTSLTVLETWLGYSYAKPGSYRSEEAEECVLPRPETPPGINTWIPDRRIIPTELMHVSVLE